MDDRELQSKLRDMEAEVNRASNSTSPELKTERVTPQVEIEMGSPRIKNWLKLSQNWFNNLPQVGKIAVGLGGVWLVFSILGTFIHLVSSVISIAFMGFILYVGYKLLLSANKS